MEITDQLEILEVMLLLRKAFLMKGIRPPHQMSLSADHAEHFLHCVNKIQRNLDIKKCLRDNRVEIYGITINLGRLDKDEHEHWAPIAALAVDRARRALKSGDRVGVTAYPDKRRVFIFSHFDGNALVSKSGKRYRAENVYSINAETTGFL